jgi:hypothetical protein
MTAAELGRQVAFPPNGLTKREEFAKVAMQGLLTHGDLPPESVAASAVYAADALLAELVKEAP